MSRIDPPTQYPRLGFIANMAVVAGVALPTAILRGETLPTPRPDMSTPTWKCTRTLSETSEWRPKGDDCCRGVTPGKTTATRWSLCDSDETPKSNMEANDHLAKAQEISLACSRFRFLPEDTTEGESFEPISTWHPQKSHAHRVLLPGEVEARPALADLVQPLQCELRDGHQRNLGTCHGDRCRHLAVHFPGSAANTHRGREARKISIDAWAQAAA